MYSRKENVIKLSKPLQNVLIVLISLRKRKFEMFLNLEGKFVNLLLEQNLQHCESSEKKLLLTLFDLMR